MSDKSLPDTDLNFAVLDGESVTHTSADQPAEKSKRPLQIADHVQGRDATAHTAEHIERKK